ncbi:MAG: helix-turn-helix domain-containing protein [Candidatus Xenobiia bacterium LiM19]
MAEFGEQLRKLRESKNMSIRDYADLIPLSVSYLSEIERGLKPTPGMKIIERIAEVLDVKPDYFDEYKADKVREAVLQDPRLDLLFKLLIRLSKKEREEVITFIRNLTDKSRKPGLDIDDRQIDSMLESIDRSFRTGSSIEIQYADRRDVLARMLSSANHIIRGRPGTGRTTLLKKAHQENLQRGNVSFYIDAEVYKNLSYPESLIRILQELFSALGDIISDNLDRSEGGLISQFVKSSERKKDLENLRKIGEAIDGKVLLLEDLLREYVYVDLSLDDKEKGARKEPKKERLEKEAVNLGLILEGICRVGGQRSLYIHIDDFHFLERPDQIRILDFLHRISKGKRIFLEVSSGSGVIAGRSGDFETIIIDSPLEDLAGHRKFMESILELHCDNREAKTGGIQTLFKSSSVFSALVLASGGVIRDFLKMFRRAVKEARIRESRFKQGIIRIEMADVSAVCLEFLIEDKYAALRSQCGPSAPGSLLLQIRNFCKENNTCFFSISTNIFSEMPAVQELLDLRLIHPVSGTHRRTGPDEVAVLMLDAGVCLEDGIPVPFEEEYPVRLHEVPLFSLISG